MKGKKFKRAIALLMAMMLLLSASACFGGDDSDSDVNHLNFNDSENGEENSDLETTEAVTVEVVDGQSALENENLRYVMIYNPRIYDEFSKQDLSTLRTGYLGSQVDVDAFRADGVEDEELPMLTYPQNLLPTLPDFKIEQNRADSVGKSYKVGDVAQFYAPTANSVDYRTLTDFQCAYEGQYCYIWTTGGASPQTIEDLGKEFDTNIYKQTTAMFGSARFDGPAGGKINLMVCPMGNSVAGVHYRFDIFATGELTEAEFASNQLNANHDILFVNETFAEIPANRKVIYSTMAHEFQHLIMAVDVLYTVNGTLCRSWLNEAMSGYVEEALYPGVQLSAGRHKALMRSGLIRKGQSLYNFEIAQGMFSNDIGVYGSVYLFSEYLANLAGKDVFSKVHEYWRDSYSSTLSEAEALANAVSPSVKSQIDNTIIYPSSLVFTNSDEEWMSKLALDFYLSLLAKKGNLLAYSYIDNGSLLYDEINEAEIEGGGRIIVAVNGGKFEIPEDADSGLVYVGLDANYKPVTSFVYK